MAASTGGRDETAVCVDCGEGLWPDIDRSFPCGNDLYLCYECAERRGGSYDAKQDRWTTPPDVSGLFDERRPPA